MGDEGHWNHWGACTRSPGSILWALDFDHFAASIMSTVWANVVGEVSFTAVGANDRMANPKGIMSASTVAPSLRDLSFRQWRHDSTPFRLHNRTCPKGRPSHYSSLQLAVKVWGSQSDRCDLNLLERGEKQRIIHIIQRYSLSTVPSGYYN